MLAVTEQAVTEPLFVVRTEKGFECFNSRSRTLFCFSRRLSFSLSLVHKKLNMLWVYVEYPPANPAVVQLLLFSEK